MPIIGVVRQRISMEHVKREYLIQQIRESERAIELSRELIKRLDELLARAGSKP